MPTYTPRQIREVVDQHERDVQALRTRMETDYDWYRLREHQNLDPVTGQALTDFAVYTSNAPRTFADKVIAWLVQAELLIRVPHLDVAIHEEEQDNLKERFAIGCLAQADERLARMLQPSLRNALAFYSCVRGGYVGGRALLAKRPDGSTYVDITAWDPMHTHWSVGPDGLEWAAYKQRMTRAQIRRVYGVDISGAVRPDGTPMGSSDAEAEGVSVYDFYDGFYNMVVTDGMVLKLPTPHGSPRVPVYLVLLGAQPLLQQENLDGLIAHVGESVYGAVRGIYEKNNDIMSVLLEIVARARRQTTVLESRDGKKTLPADPYVQGTDISLATGEKVYTLELQRMAQETAAYMGIVAGEIQRGTLPYSVYGELQFQLSGFAINTLRQGIETVLSSRLEAIERAEKQIVGLLYDQFMTNAFDGVRLSGVDAHRKYFNQQITPELLADTCDYTVRLKSQLPQDDMSKWAMAQIASEGKFLSKADILDTIVELQDSQQAIDKVKAEIAEQGLPEATLYTLMVAAANRGDTVIAQMYLAEFQRLMAVKLGVMPNLGGTGSGQGGTASPGPDGQRPEVMPNAVRGGPPAPETSNSGSGMVAPQTPRPGARGQQDQNRQL